MNRKVSTIFIVMIIICSIIFFYQTKKTGFHEDEVYTLSSSVNPKNGLMEAVDTNKNPEWKNSEYVRKYMTLTPNNYLNFVSIFLNQAKDNHPPFFYTLVHFSSILFSGKFNLYTIFIVNIIAFILSCLVIINILKLLNREHLAIPLLIFYGLSMGTISMVIFQRMYMLLTFFILLYFYLSLKIYKNDFNITKKMKIELGLTTVLGFLTQYFFAIYAFFIFAIMIIQMIKEHKSEEIKKYIFLHILYAITGVILFVPSLYHLFFSDRGLKNLANSSYFSHLITYLKHLAYAFNINSNVILIAVILILFTLFTILLYKRSKEKFIVLLTIIPSIFYFLLVVKLTSFQKLRYVMPIFPFIAITLFLILDEFIKVKHKYIIFWIFSIILVMVGMIYSEPKFLYKNYKEYIDIAKENKDKSFVYVYDNSFNHMQSVPEMMIYKRTMILNTHNNELKYLLNDESLNEEESYILSIKDYMNSDEIIEKIKNNSKFKNVKLIKQSPYTSYENEVNNNLYLISK